jgi:hypothetical protein
MTGARPCFQSRAAANGRYSSPPPRTIMARAGMGGSSTIQSLAAVRRMGCRASQRTASSSRGAVRRRNRRCFRRDGDGLAVFGLRSAVGGWRLAVGGWRWAVGGGRWAVGGWRWAVGGGRWAVGGGRWAVGGWQLAVGGWRLAVGGWRLAVEGRGARGGGWLEDQSSENQCYAHDSPAAESCYYLCGYAGSS